MITKYQNFVNEFFFFKDKPPLKSDTNKLKVERDKFSGMNDDGYSAVYNISIGSDYIGSCMIDAILKEDNFDDKDLDGGDIERDYMNPATKSDYDNHKFIIKLYSFEIYDDFKGKGYGYLSFKRIIQSINKQFPKHSGIYLSVFKNNSPALKIYKKLGFVQIRDNGDYLGLKYTFQKK